jgi:hypothetical protein
MTPVLSQAIIKEWNLESVPEAKRFHIVDRLGRIMYQAILVKSLDILSDKEQDSLDDLMGKNETTPEQVLNFLRSKIPTFDLLMKEERNNLKRTFAV